MIETPPPPRPAPARRGLRWRVRFLLGGWCQHLAWRLSDPHDSWLVEYHSPEGYLSGQVVTGSYRMARAKARELKGRILGNRAREIPA